MSFGRFELVTECCHYNGRTGYPAPSLKRTSHVMMCFYRRVWYCALSLCSCIRRPGIILIL